MQAFSYGCASAKISVIVLAMFDLKNRRELGRGAASGVEKGARKGVERGKNAFA